jgi:SAM-dependent methyltransferase
MQTSLDKSNGYNSIAEDFMRARNQLIGPATVLEWSRTLPPGISILDLGCGYGEPISTVLMDQGFQLYGVDASPKMIAAFQARFPQAYAVCEPVEESGFFHRTFDAVLAWGLIFLLSPELQHTLFQKVTNALNAGGSFLFTSPKPAQRWYDSLTGFESVSLGADTYTELLRENGLTVIGNAIDQGENYYYFARKL